MHLNITAGHKNHKLLNEAFLYSRINQELEELFNKDFPTYINDLKKTSISIKKSEQLLKLTLKCENIQFLSWLESQNIHLALSQTLISKKLIEDKNMLKIAYKII